MSAVIRWAVVVVCLTLSSAHAQVIVTAGTGVGAGWHPTNVQGYGAVGDNVADDTAAIQAAIDTASIGDTIFFPPGTYKVSAPLVLNGKRVNLLGVGYTDGGSQLLGTVNGAIIDNTPTSGTAQGGSIEKLKIRNTHATGMAIQWQWFTGGVIRDVMVTGFYGIVANGPNFTLLIEDVVAWGPGGSPAGSLGIVASGHTTILTSDIVGWDEGIRAGGVNVNIHGCRFEVNNTAIVGGRDFANASLLLSRSLIAGNSFEANGTGIRADNVSSSLFSALGMQGSAGAPGGMSHYGLVINSMSDTLIAGIGIAGQFDQAAIRMTGAARVQFAQATASNALTGKKVWDVLVPLANVSFHQTNYELREDNTVTSTLQDGLGLQSLMGATHTEPMLQGKNVRGKNVAVGSGVSTLAVGFQPDRTAGQAAINVATPGTGAGTLVEGTYFYIATLVTELGESGATGEKTATVTLPNNQVAFTFFGVPGLAGWKRRIYRGTATGAYDGYFETALNASTFTDIGATFTGVKSPPNTAETSMQEPDANYAVIVTPAWNTTTWITGKATTGFTVNFGTAPGVNSTLDWFIVR